MLILTRGVGEIIKIGDDIDVTVVAVNGQQIRIGIQAPRSTAINREEIYLRILRERGIQKPDGDPDAA